MDEPLYAREFPDGREAHIWLQLFRTARLCIGQKGSMLYDDEW